jgi:hypothetical protein
MADNAAGTGFGGASVTFATDDIGGINYPRFKVTFGVDGVATDVSSSNPLPVSAPASGFKIDFDGFAVSSSNPLPTTALTQTQLENTTVFINGAVTAQGTIQEDTVHNSGDYGIFMLAVRNDTDAATAGNGDYTSFQTDSLGRLKTSSTGAAAQGATASGNPVFTGGVAKTAQPTARTDGQIVAPLYSKVGHQIAMIGQVRDLNDTISPITLSTTAETTLVPAVAAVFNDIYSITIANTSASAVMVDFRTVAAGAVVESVLVPASSTIQLNPAVPYKQATVNTAWTAQLSAAVTDVRISARVVRNI